MNRLNEYHLQFLQPLVERGVLFMIVGGQARSIHEGAVTRDLDIWVDISPSNRPALDHCLIAWATKYPMHSAASFSPPLPLRRNVQIQFPDADVLFLGDNNELSEIGPEDGIDVLTSIGSSSFGEFYGRAHWEQVAGLKLPFLARNDLEKISPPKSR
jgi:hypothetical protein